MIYGGNKNKNLRGKDMASVVDVKKLNKIRDNYPDTWEWMKHKASWEHMTLGSVLDGYEEYIDELMKKEDRT